MKKIAYFFIIFFSYFLTSCTNALLVNVERFNNFSYENEHIGKKIYIKAKNNNGDLINRSYAQIISTHLAKYGMEVSFDENDADYILEYQLSIDQGKEEKSTKHVIAEVQSNKNKTITEKIFNRENILVKKRVKQEVNQPKQYLIPLEETKIIYTKTLKIDMYGILNRKDIFKAVAYHASEKNNLSHSVFSLVNAAFNNFPGKSIENYKIHADDE